MNRVTQKVLEKLLRQKKGPMVTMYIPTLRSGSATNIRESQMRFKNLQRRAEEILRLQDHDVIATSQILERLETLHGDYEFWENRLEGTVICINPASTNILDLPIDTEEYLAVDSHYHLAPLFGVVQDNREYYVLMLAAHSPRLLAGDMYGLSDARIKLPHDPVTALNIDELSQRQHHYHSKARSGKSGGTATGQHAGSNAKDTGDEQLLQFFRMIDAILTDKADTARPLLLAGVSKEIAEYRRVSKYPRIYESVVHGNYSNESIDTLHHKFWPIVYKEEVEPSHRNAVSRYFELKSQDRASIRSSEVIDAAEHGRIETLLVPFTATTRDAANDSTEEVQRITFMDEVKNLYVDEVVLHAWDQGAYIYNLDSKDMPESALTAAVLRY